MIYLFFCSDKSLPHLYKSDMAYPLPFTNWVQLFFLPGVELNILVLCRSYLLKGDPPPSELSPYNCPLTI